LTSSDSRPRRARELFDQLLDRPREERDAHLKKSCGSDRSLELEVRSLLEAHHEAEGFLEAEQVSRALTDLTAEHDDPLVGAVIGDYRILGLLGRGGMGAVYRAEQEHPHRQVALKLIDRSITTPDLLRRFEVEAEVLARLKHPGIAQIHVAGTTGAEHGDRPYFAMELVEGQPLTTFADERHLDLHQRLELLIKGCEAVQHAHQVGVIHRDLKPANIFVTAEGQPKILDFGIARSTDTDLQITTVADGKAMLIGTLPYMSPEQVRGDPSQLDTRSDVYALGVLGYELLTGSFPRDLEGKPLTDAIRTIVDEEPRPLGAAGQGRFSTDLETIVGKALESDRQRRYDSASGFAADLRRFLDGQPISARPQSTIYQLRKLVARNRLPAGLLAGLVLLAIVSAVIMAFQIRRTVRERDRAGVEAATANEASTFLESLFMQADPEQALGQTLTAREVLDRGAMRIETELQDQPVVRGRLLAMLGKVYDGLGVGDRAAPLLKEAVAIGRALQAEREEVGDPSNLELALCLYARCAAREGRNEEAVAMCREAVQLTEAVYGPESQQVATCLNHLAYQLSLVSEFDEARIQLERGLALREKLLGPDDVDVGWSVYQYAHVLNASGARELARAQFERACTIWETSLPENHPQTARGFRDYAQVLGDAGEYEAALEYAERALAIQEKTLGRRHPDVADTLNDVGYLNWRVGNLPEAHRYFTDAVEAHRQSYGPADPELLNRLQNVVRISNMMDRPEVAEAALMEARDLALEHHGDEPNVLAGTQARLGFHYASQRRAAEAIPLLREAAELYEQAGEAFARDLLIMRDSLVPMLLLEDEAAEALALSERVLATVLEHPELERPNPLFARWRIGQALVRLGRLEEAEAWFRELLPEAEASFEVNAFFPWNIRWLIGHCRHGLGYEDEARELYDQVLEVDPESLTEDRCWLHLRMAEELAAEGAIDEARRELNAALEAGLDARAGQLALLLDPRLGPSERREMARVMD